MTTADLLHETATIDVLAEVAAERADQDAKWGEQNHPNGTGPDVILRDLSAYRNAMRADHFAVWARDTTNGNAADGLLTFADILLEEVAEALEEADPARLRDELVQVAAVAAAWVESIDRAATR